MVVAAYWMPLQNISHKFLLKNKKMYCEFIFEQTHARIQGNFLWQSSLPIDKMFKLYKEKISTSIKIYYSY